MFERLVKRIKRRREHMRRRLLQAEFLEDRRLLAATEPNDGFGSAALLAVVPGHEFSQRGDAIDASGDNDYFQFTLSEPGTIRLDADAREQGLSELDTVLYLYDGNEQEVAFNDDGIDPESGYEGLDSALEYYAAAAGTYYARVGGFAETSTGAYKLEVLVSLDADDSGVDPYEENGVNLNNDDFDRAAPLAVIPDVEFTTLGASILTGDDDYFQFTLDGSGTIRLDTDAQERNLSNVDTVLHLYDANRNQLAVNDDGVDPESGVSGLDSALQYRALVGGTYFARVSGFGGNSTGAYQLEILVALDPDRGDDAYEPNDDRGSASFLDVTPGVTFTTVGAKILPGDDVDFFRFTVTSPGTIRLDTNAGEFGLSDLDTVLHLYDANGHELAVNDDGTDPDTGYRGLNSALEYHTDAPGDFYARVTSFAGGSVGAYELEVLLTLDQRLIDPYEMAAGFADNNGFDRATPLAVAADTQFVTSGARIDVLGDDDYFVFTVDGPSTIALDTTAQSLLPPSEVDTVLYLHDADHNELAFNDDVESQLDSVLQHAVDAAGTYFARVSGFGGHTAGNYDLKILVTPGVAGGDPYETSGGNVDNNDFDRAAALAVVRDVAFVTSGANIQPMEDDDYYEFTLDRPGRIRLDIDAQEQGHSAVDTVLYLYDEDRNQLGFNDDGTDPQSHYGGLDSALQRAVDAGTYFVRVSAFEGASAGVYELEILVTAGAAPPVDPYEPNDNFATAISLDVKPNQQFTTMDAGILPVGEFDFFKFKVDDPGTIRLDIDAGDPTSPLASALDSELHLFGPNRREVAANDDGTDPESGYTGYDSALEYYARQTGMYYVRVSGFANNSTGKYDLNILVTQAADDPHEGSGNDDFATATPIDLATNRFTTLGAIDPDNDDDYYRFEFGAPGSIRLDIDAREQGLSAVDTVLHLYDSDMHELAVNDDGRDPESGYQGLDSALTRHVDAAGTYYVRVSSFDASSTGDYELEIILTPVQAGMADPFEPNDHFADVTAGDALTTVPDMEHLFRGASIADSDDVDLFRFTLAAPGTIRLDTDAQEHGLSAVDTVLQLYDDAENELAFNDDAIDPDTGNGGLDSALEYHVDAGTYYARVSGFGDTTGAYNLEILVISGPADGNDPYEAQTDNNVIERASDLSVQANVEFITNGTVIAPAGDDDYFQFTLAGPGMIRLDTDAQEQRHSSVDTVVTLYDAHGRQLAQNDDGTDPETGYEGLDSALTYHVNAGGAYYARVSGFAGMSSGAYDLQVLVTPDEPADEVLRQAIWLNFGGGRYVDAEFGTESIPPFDVSDFGFAESDRQRVIEQVVRLVKDDFINSGSFNNPETPLNLPFDIVTRQPEGPHSTVVIGGYHRELLGQAQSVDFGNLNRSDDAVVYSAAIAEEIGFELAADPTFAQAAQSIADTISHEAGHLLGLLHVSDDGLLMQSGELDQSRVDDERFGFGHLFPPPGTQDAVEVLRGNIRNSAANADSKEANPETVVLVDPTKPLGESCQDGQTTYICHIQSYRFPAAASPIEYATQHESVNASDQMAHVPVEGLTNPSASGQQTTVTLNSTVAQNERSSNTNYFNFRVVVKDSAGSIVAQSGPRAFDSSAEYNFQRGNVVEVHVGCLTPVATYCSSSNTKLNYVEGYNIRFTNVKPPSTMDTRSSAARKGTVIDANDETDHPPVFDFFDGSGEHIRVEWSGAGLATILLEDDADGNDIARIQIQDAEEDSVLRVLSDETQAATRIGQISVAGSGPMDLILGSPDLRVDLESFESSIGLDGFELSGSLCGVLAVQGHVNTLITDEITGSAAVDISGDLRKLHVGSASGGTVNACPDNGATVRSGTVSGPIRVGGTLFDAEVAGSFLSSLSVDSLNTLQIADSLGAPPADGQRRRSDADLRELIHVANTAGSITIGEDLFTTIRSRNGMENLTVGGNLAGLVRSDDGVLGRVVVGGDGVFVGAGDAVEGALESTGSSAIEIQLIGRGTAAHAIDILRDSNVLPTLEIFDHLGRSLSQGLRNGQRISLAGYDPGIYSIALSSTKPDSYSFAFDTQTEPDEPALAAVDIDGDGQFNTVADYRLVRLAQEGGATDAVAQLVEDLADALDIDGDGNIDSAVDRRLISLARNGIPAAIIEQFRAPGATRSGEAIIARATGLLAHAEIGSGEGGLSTTASTQVVHMQGPTVVDRGRPFAVTLDYQTLDQSGQPVNVGTDSLGIRVHFNSGLLNIDQAASSIFQTNMSFNGLQFPPIAETAASDDGDPETDAFFLFTWAEDGGGFQPGNQPLLTLSAEASAASNVNVVVLHNDSDADFRQQVNAAPVASVLSNRVLFGAVFADGNNNGVRDPWEAGIANVEVVLTGPDTRAAVTAADGSFQFRDLPAGTYALHETHPLAFIDGIETAGSTSNGTPGNDTFGNIGLSGATDLQEYLFGERGLQARFVSLTPFLARSAPTQAFPASGEGELTAIAFRATTDGSVTLTAEGENALELFDSTMTSLARGSGGTLTTAVESGKSYVLYVAAGAAGGAVAVDARTVPGTLRLASDDVILHNPILKTDVNSDGVTGPTDARLIINHLNHPQTPRAFPIFGDVNGDRLLTPIDVLQIVNWLNISAASSAANSTGAAEGEAAVGPFDFAGTAVTQQTLTTESTRRQATVAARRAPQPAHAATNPAPASRRVATSGLRDRVFLTAGEADAPAADLETAISLIAGDVAEFWRR